MLDGKVWKCAELAMNLDVADAWWRTYGFAYDSWAAGACPPRSETAAHSGWRAKIIQTMFEQPGVRLTALWSLPNCEDMRDRSSCDAAGCSWDPQPYDQSCGFEGSIPRSLSASYSKLFGCAANAGAKVGDPTVSGQGAVWTETAICPNSFDAGACHYPNTDCLLTPTCTGFVMGKRMGQCTLESICIADYGSKPGDKTCCGQTANISVQLAEDIGRQLLTPEHLICNSSKPVCKCFSVSHDHDQLTVGTCTTGELPSQYRCISDQCLKSYTGSSLAMCKQLCGLNQHW